MVRQRDRWNFKFQNVAATPLLQITGAKSQIIKLPVLQNSRIGQSVCFCVHVKSLILIRSRDLLRVVIWIIDLASSCYLEVLLVPSRLLVKGAFNFNRRCIIHFFWMNSASLFWSGSGTSNLQIGRASCTNWQLHSLWGARLAELKMKTWLHVLRAFSPEFSSSSNSSLPTSS